LTDGVHELEKLLQRLECICSSPIISKSGADVVSQVVSLNILANNLSQALHEIAEHIEIATEFDLDTPSGLKGEILLKNSQCRAIAAKLKELNVRIRSSQTPILLRGMLFDGMQDLILMHDVRQMNMI
jgi:hypothetical protein